MKAIIMAGGEGTRLRPLTSALPKPMAPVMNRPCMEHSIRLLKKHGITDIGVTLMYMPGEIKSYFGDGREWGVRLTYFLEETPLGTAGSVKNTGDFLDGDFLVISGDAITSADLSAFMDFHREKKAEASLLLCPMDVPLEYGVVVTDEDGKIQRFLEKPSWSQVFSDTVNTGIYILNPSVLSLGKGLPLDFSKDIFPAMLKAGRPLYGYVSKAYWCDIGDLDAYRHCHYDIFSTKAGILPDACRLSPGIYAEEGAVIEAGAVLIPPVCIGKNSRIQSGATIDGYTCIGADCTIESGASVKRSVLLDKVTVERGAAVRGSILCKNVHVGKGASLFEQSVIGQDSRIGKDAVVKPGVRIWPAKLVGEGEILSRNLVWGNAVFGELFSARGICGNVGTDISPSAAQKLGQAVGTVFGGKLGIAAGGGGAAKMLSMAAQSGMMSTGKAVLDLGEQTLPLCRAAARGLGLSAVVYVWADDNVGQMEIVTETGKMPTYSEMQKIRTAFFREDFALGRAEKQPENPASAPMEEAYLTRLRAKISGVRGGKILVHSPSPKVLELLRRALEDTDVHILSEETCADEKALASATAKHGCTFGLLLDGRGEKAVFCDEKGRTVDEDVQDVLFAKLTLSMHPGCTLYAPASMPHILEKLAEEAGGNVVRTKTDTAAFYNAIFPGEPSAETQAAFHFDGIAAALQLLFVLHKEQTTLSALVDSLPPFYICRGEVPCARKDKGRLMRLLSEESEGTQTEGVLFQEKHGDAWILPDDTRPLCRVIAQGSRAEFAAEIAEGYIEKIRNFLGDGEKGTK